MGHTCCAVHYIHGGAGTGLPMRQHLYPKALQRLCTAEASMYWSSYYLSDLAPVSCIS